MSNDRDDRDDEDRRIILRRRALLLAGVVSGLGLAVAAPDAGSAPCPVHGPDDAPRAASRTRRPSADAGATSSSSTDAASTDATDAAGELEPEPAGGFDPRALIGPPRPSGEIRLPRRDEVISCLSPCLSPCLSLPPPQGCTCGRRRVPIES